jgi:hypothetical protein
MDHIPEKGELILYTLQMDVNKIRNKLSSIYMTGIQDSKTSWLETMLVKAQKKVKDELNKQDTTTMDEFPWQK